MGLPVVRLPVGVVGVFRPGNDFPLGVVGHLLDGVKFGDGRVEPRVHLPDHKSLHADRNGQQENKRV